MKGEGSYTTHPHEEKVAETITKCDVYFEGGCRGQQPIQSTISQERQLKVIDREESREAEREQKQPTTGKGKTAK